MEGEGGEGEKNQKTKEAVSFGRADTQQSGQTQEARIVKDSNNGLVGEGFWKPDAPPEEEARNPIERWLMRRMSRRKAVETIGATVGVVAAAPAIAALDKIDGGSGGGSSTTGIVEYGVNPLKDVNDGLKPRMEYVPPDKREKTWNFSLNIEVNREFLQMADNVLQTRLFVENGVYTGDRIKVETALSQSVSSFDDIDCALSVCFIPTIRAELLAKRAKLREADPNTYKLSPEEKKFAADHNINPEIFALCQEVRKEMPAILNQPEILTSSLFKLSESDKQNLDQVLAKGMGRLIMRETDGFIKIGDGPAVDQLEGEYDTDRDLLKQYCNYLYEKTGLHYTPDNIPGSLKGPNDSSGGAIGIQFMPRYAVQFSEFLKNAGYTGNIFNIKESIAMAYLYMICHGIYGQGAEDYPDVTPKVIEGFIKKEKRDPTDSKEDQAFLKFLAIVGIYEGWNDSWGEASDIAHSHQDLVSLEAQYKTS